jgi:hypothetical protein
VSVPATMASSCAGVMRPFVCTITRTVSFELAWALSNLARTYGRALSLSILVTRGTGERSGAKR